MQLNNISKTGTWGESSDRLNQNFSKVSVEIEKSKQFSKRNKGLFDTLDALKKAVPSPDVGDWAVVGKTIPGLVYKCSTKGVWASTGQQGGGDPVDLNGYITAEDVTDLTTIIG